MRNVALLFFLACLAGCVTVSDGPFRQVSGCRIDYEVLDALEENRSTINDALIKLGDPASRTLLPGGLEEVVYTSVKRRESVQRFLGIVSERHTQIMNERVLLLFKDGTLIQRQKSYDERGGGREP